MDKKKQSTIVNLILMGVVFASAFLVVIEISSNIYNELSPASAVQAAVVDRQEVIDVNPPKATPSAVPTPAEAQQHPTQTPEEFDPNIDTGE